MNIIEDNRPWGTFKQFTHNEESTVKIIKVEPGQRLSLQYHNIRREFWVILSGSPVIRIGNEEKIASKDDEFFIDKKVVHRLAGGESGAEVLEISMGEFDEDDIVRIEDDYKRIV